MSKIFLTVKVFLFGVKIMNIQLDSKITLNSDPKLKAIKHNTNGNIILSLLCIILIQRYSLHCIIRNVKELKIHPVETVGDVSQKLNVHVLTYVKQEKRDQNVKRNQKHSKTSPDVHFREFSDLFRLCPLYVMPHPFTYRARSIT